MRGRVVVAVQRECRGDASSKRQNSQSESKNKLGQGERGRSRSFGLARLRKDERGLNEGAAAFLRSHFQILRISFQYQFPVGLLSVNVVTESHENRVIRKVRRAHHELVSN